MEHCDDLGWTETNPARGVSELKPEKSEREPWPQELLETYRAACSLDTRERLVMEPCVGTGQRIGDVLEMRWSDIKYGAVFVRPSKTKKKLWVPILSELLAALEAASRQRALDQSPVLQGRLSGCQKGERSTWGPWTTTSTAGATTPHVSLWRRDAVTTSLRPSPAKARLWSCTTPRRSASGSEPFRRC
jgi:integrase